MKKLATILSVVSFLIIGCETETDVYPEGTTTENTEGVTFDEVVLGKKVKINHKGKIINVSVNALQAHINHGDTRVY